MTKGVNSNPDTPPDENNPQRERIELQKLRLEVKEQRAWKAKWLSTLLISFLGPIGAAIAFVAGLYVSRSTDRKASTDARFSQAVQLASNSDVSMRMAGMMSLRSFTARSPSGWTGTGWLANALDYSGEIQSDRERANETVALVVARLSVETDPSLLLLMKETVVTNSTTALPLLLAANRQAANELVRASGKYSGMAILRILMKTQANQDDLWVQEARNTAVESLVTNILRNGSPFGIPGEDNQVFQPRPFLEDYAFKTVFLSAERQALFSDESKQLNPRSSPPGAWQIQDAVNSAASAYSYVVRTSDLLLELANGNDGWIATQDLHGNAIVRGKMDEKLIEELRKSGAYVQSSPSS